MLFMWGSTDSRGVELRRQLNVSRDGPRPEIACKGAFKFSIYDSLYILCFKNFIKSSTKKLLSIIFVVFIFL